MSALTSGASGTFEGMEAQIAAAQQDAAALRGIFDAVQDALAAALARLDALELQVRAFPDTGQHNGTGGSLAPPANGTPQPPAAASGAASPPMLPQRLGADWRLAKLAEWTPTAGVDVVTGETLRARREALGVSQAAVAHAAHCSRGLVAEVERGKRRSAQTLAHLASVLDRLAQQARRN